MKKTWSYHPVLFALFPVLFLYSRNIDGFPLRVILIPAALLVAGALAIRFVLSRVVRSGQRAALLVSFFLLMFFSYGHFYDVLWSYFATAPTGLGTRKAIILLYFLILAAGTFLICRMRRSLAIWTRLTQLFAIFLLFVPVIQIVTHTLTLDATPGRDFRPSFEVNINDREVQRGDYPDIYYIILDAYARADVLAEVYGYDNSEFIDYLRAKGFFVAARARANYPQTVLSLYSSLNMRYLDPAAYGLQPDSDARMPLTTPIYYNRSFEFLRGLGYQSVMVSSGCLHTDIKNADLFIETGTPLLFLDEFQNGLLSGTPLPLLVRKLSELSITPGGIGDVQADAHRGRILRMFHELGRIAEYPGPKMVFAHFPIPHTPYVFGPNGERLSLSEIFTFNDGNEILRRDKMIGEEYAAKYTDQLGFTNHMVQAALDTILAKSPRPPIIILQADHGPGLQLDWNDIRNTNIKERLSILSAYYLPDGADTMLYQSITPVNTFRVIFNHYYGAQFELLDDRSYFSSYYSPYQLTDVTAELVGRTESGIDSEQQTNR